MNERDSENIAANFVDLGWELSKDENEADAIVINTCSVREQAETKAIGKLSHILSARKSSGKALPVIGVTGCMAQNLGEEIVRRLPDIDFVIGSRKTHMVAETAAKIYARILSEETPLSGLQRSSPAGEKRAFVDVSDDESSHLLINRHLKSGPCASISIMQGCGMKCSYCIVPKTRGQQRSRPEADILAEARALISAGAKEILLLGQVVNAYGENIEAFPKLLEDLSGIEGLLRLRFTSPHPVFFTDRLVNLYGTLPQLCEYVHLPLQSGSDKILKEMRRPYRAEKFLEIVEKLRARAPQISISTDIIVGYPGESDEDFEKTLEMFKKCAFDMAFIFKYSPRAGTKSAEIPDDVPSDVKEQRNQILLKELARTSLEYNQRLVGKSEEVLIESPARRGENIFMGRTRTHRKVVFPASANDIGRLADVDIKSATVTTIEGEICRLR